MGDLYTQPVQPAPPLPPTFDCGAMWDQLTPELQRYIGERAIGSVKAWIAATELVPRSGRHKSVMSAIASINAQLISHLCEISVAQGVPLVARPDLAKLGIASCRKCGCTQEHACADRCWWAEPDLCSSCSPEHGGSP